MYNSNIYNTSINVVTARTEPTTQYNSIKNYPSNAPLNMMKPTVHTYGYISLYETPRNEQQTWMAQQPVVCRGSRPVPQCGTFPAKSVLKKSKYDGSNSKPSSTSKKITFENKNHVVFTVDKEFYTNNNLKGSIWWSAQELMFIRNMVMSEAVRIQRNNPNLNIGQCIKEICKYN
jgi:hypothetical protein